MMKSLLAQVRDVPAGARLVPRIDTKVFGATAGFPLAALITAVTVGPVGAPTVAGVAVHVSPIMRLTVAPFSSAGSHVWTNCVVIPFDGSTVTRTYPRPFVNVP